MRIKKLQIAGLAVALVGVAADRADAADVTISNASDPVVTSAPDGVSPGDVTIQSGGSIELDASGAGVTVDSSNDVSNAGRISAEDVDGVTGILLQGGNAGEITNSGTLSLVETYELEDDNDDGDLDGAWATGSNRYGILLQGGTFTGDITHSGTITVEGNTSAGIRLDGVLGTDGADLDGTLTTTGTITVTGDNAQGIAINGGLAGDALLRSNITVRGQDSSAITVDGDIAGALRISGGISATGYHSTTAPSDTSDLDDPDDFMQSRAAVDIRANVVGGVVIEGTGVENDDDDDGDLDLESDSDGDSNDNNAGSISVFGSAPALLVAGSSEAITLGNGVSGFGLDIRGSLTASGVYDNFTATGLRIEGLAGGAVDTTDGVRIDGSVQAVAQDAAAYGVFIGDGAIVDTLLTRNLIAGTAVSDALDNAYGIYVTDGSAVSAIQNIGIIRGRVLGEQGTATAIYDELSSIDTITNSGSIIADIIQTDEDPSDDVDPPAITGEAIAIDLRNSSNNIVLTQQALASPFTDQDSDDDSADPDVLISGNIYLGGGADIVNLLAGEITGDIAFGAGADTFNIANGAVYTGRLIENGGQLTLNVGAGELNLDAGQIDVTAATFGSGSVLSLTLSDTPGGSTFINASGAVSFDSNASIRIAVPEGLPESNTATPTIFLTAGALDPGGVLGTVEGEGTPYLYNVSVEQVLGDPNSLQAIYALKSAADLNLTANQSAAYQSIIAALRSDDDAAAAISAIDDAVAFNDAYEDLMPSYAAAAAELAATAIQQMQSATTNRLANTRLHDMDEVSVWAQEIGYGLDRQAPTPNGQDYSGYGFGLAVGVDGPLNNGALFGLSGAFLSSEAEESGRPEGEISTWLAQANAYLGTAMGPVDLDFVLGGGFGKMKSRRFVEIGDDYEAQTEAEWWAYEGHAAGRASVPLALTNWFIVTPQAALTYVVLGEQGYTEEGGGAAIDYDADDTLSQRLWGDAGVEFSTRWTMRGGGVIAPRIFAGYRANLIDEEAERTFRFAAGGSEFTLVDEGVGEGGPLVGIGVDASNGYSTFSIAYEGEFNDQIERHSVNAAIRFRF